jgi:RNA polymerase sigma factor (sigma-70 family)
VVDLLLLAICYLLCARSVPATFPGIKSGPEPSNVCNVAAFMDFDALVDANYAALFRFALSLTKNEDQAADLVQQTFYRWATKSHQLREPSRAQSWLFTTLYHEFISVCRHQHFVRQVELDDLPEEATDADFIANKLDGVLVREALFSLDEIYRAPLALFYLSELSYCEIAEALSIPIGTVMSRISRGKALLRRLLVQTQLCPVRKVIPIPERKVSL